MSILINGMDMPTDCAMLLKIFPDGRVGVPVHLNWMGTMVVNDAEAVPVPSHGRCIDADAIKVSFAYAEETGDWSVPQMRTVLKIIDAAPTVIPASK